MSIYDERPIGDIYVEWANTLDSAGEDSTPVRERLGDINTLIRVKSMMNDIIWASERADHVKKFLFYGKEGVMEKIALDSEEFHIIGPTTAVEVGLRFDDHNKIRLLHAVLGHASEIGELMTALYNYFFEGEPLDDENIAEEFGDMRWYDALGAKYLGHMTFNELMAGNKAKLVKRYGEGWTQDAALNRDTGAEMKALHEAIVEPGKTPPAWENAAQASPIEDIKVVQRSISDTGTCPECLHGWHCDPDVHCEDPTCDCKYTTLKAGRDTSSDIPTNG